MRKFTRERTYHLHRCQLCDCLYMAARSDARLCSARCRQWARRSEQRRRRKEKARSLLVKGPDPAVLAWMKGETSDQT